MHICTYPLPISVFPINILKWDKRKEKLRVLESASINYITSFYSPSTPRLLIGLDLTSGWSDVSDPRALIG